jgi:hypothetical protein
MCGTSLRFLYFLINLPLPQAGSMKREIIMLNVLTARGFDDEKRVT